MRWVVCLVGFPRIRRLGHLLGGLQYYFGGKIRRRCLHDLAALQGRSPSDPVVVQQLLDAYRNYAKAALQIVAMCEAKLDVAVLNRECRLEGLQHLEAALKAGRGAIMLATHAGNGVLLAAQLASAGWPMAVVYRQALMMPEGFFAEGLPRYGIEGIAANDGAKAYARMRRAIKQNRIVFVIIDQGVKNPKDGIPMRFLGKVMPMPAGPAQLARQTGAPILPLRSLAAEPVWHFEIEPPVQFPPGSTLEEDLQLLLQINERQILARPDLWGWPHRRWRKFPLALTES